MTRRKSINPVRHRRIYNELSELNSGIDFIFEKNNIQRDSIHQVTMEKDGDTYEFKLLITYPFTPPILYINNVEYIQQLHKYWLSFKSFYNIKSICICESTILCSNRWSPGFKIIDILNEIENTKIRIKSIYKRSYVERVMNRYNIFENGIIEKTKDFIII